MNTQNTISPTMRSLLTLMGSAGILVLMFFDNTQPISNIFVLAGIIPLILGLTGDNLFSSFFTHTTLLDAPAPTPSPVRNAPVSIINTSPSAEDNTLDKRAAYFGHWCTGRCFLHQIGLSFSHFGAILSDRLTLTGRRDHAELYQPSRSRL